MIFSAGDPGDRFFVVREGTVTLSANGRNLEDVGPGGIFGELGVLERAPRSATATAATDATSMPLDERAFIFHVSQTPFFALTVMRVLADRLRRETSSRERERRRTGARPPDLRGLREPASRAGSKRRRSSSVSPSSARATRSPHASPSALPWPE